MTSAGNIVVYSTQGGEINVVNATTGEKLYSFNTNHNNDAGPSTGLVNGTQMIFFHMGGLPQFGTAGDTNPVNNGGLVIALGLK